MNHNEPQISMSTLVEISPLLGLRLGKNASIRNGQEIELALKLQNLTSVQIEDSYKKDFYFGILDFLPYKLDGSTQFKFLEFCGSGSGGITNISSFALNAIMDELKDVCLYIDDPMPVILLAYTDSQSLSNSIPKKFVFEKFLYAEAIKEGFKNKFGSATITTLFEILEKNKFNPTQPTIVIGFLKDFLKQFQCKDNNLIFFDQKVSCLINDTLCNNSLNSFKSELNFNSIYNINHIYRLTADKSLSYFLYNDMIKEQSFKNFSEPIRFSLANNKEELIEEVFAKTQSGEKLVIKPYAGSVGMGVEFFLTPESKDIIKHKVEESIHTIETFQGLKNRCFPYSISEFVDYLSIDCSDHELNNHKYELRVIVYREKNLLKVFPAAVRVAALPYDRNNFDRLMLLSYASLPDSKITLPKYKFLMPLTNYKTLNLLNISYEDLENLCAFSTSYIHYAINNLKRYD